MIFGVQPHEGCRKIASRQAFTIGTQRFYLCLCVLCFAPETLQFGLINFLQALLQGSDFLHALHRLHQFHVQINLILC